MGKFLDELVVKKVDKRHWELVRKLRYRRNNKKYVIVPAGFITDFASVPRLFWSIMPPGADLYCAPSIVHDYLYYSQTIPRKECDDVFLEAMEASGVPLWKRKSMYYAVRMFGWRGWNKRANED